MSKGLGTTWDPWNHHGSLLQRSQRFHINEETECHYVSAPGPGLIVSQGLPLRHSQSHMDKSIFVLRKDMMYSIKMGSLWHSLGALQGAVTSGGLEQAGVLRHFVPLPLWLSCARNLGVQRNWRTEHCSGTNGRCTPPSLVPWRALCLSPGLTGSVFSAANRRGDEPMCWLHRTQGVGRKKRGILESYIRLP
jgi:hypothetical protein